MCPSLIPRSASVHLVELNFIYAKVTTLHASSLLPSTPKSLRPTPPHRLTGKGATHAGTYKYWKLREPQSHISLH